MSVALLNYTQKYYNATNSSIQNHSSPSPYHTTESVELKKLFFRDTKATVSFGETFYV